MESAEEGAMQEKFALQETAPLLLQALAALPVHVISAFPVKHAASTLEAVRISSSV